MLELLMSASFWTAVSAIVASLALLLSQIPPIRTFIGRRKPILTTTPAISITHYLGAPNIQLFLNIENDSPRSLKIKNISMQVTRLGTTNKTLPAFTIFEKPDSHIQTVFAPFTIKPESNWAKNVTFYAPFEGSVEQKLKSMQYKIRNSINNKRNAIQHLGADQPQPIVTADETYVQEAIAFYNANKFWEPGDYSINLSITTDSPKTSIQQRYIFLLTLPEINELDSAAERYKFGSTLTYADNTAWVYPSLRVNK
ncbi:hypothetical protein [Yersinia ruckeri]|uniref:hypothetical protein n=1 Tax=Yersinia ruckeri TaxID=29486 RepID=UPI00119DFD9D|nr:hypothetical protein [Yersinia ruckeri]